MAQFLFGGTFDPPHLGHSRIIDTLLSLAPLGEDSEVTVIPSYHPPAKNPPLLSYDQRVALCEKAFMPLDHRVAISTIEAQLAPPSYFINTLAAHSADSAARRKGKPVMVIGFDQLKSLHQWYEAQQLFQQVDIWVLDRHAEDAFGTIVAQLRHFGVSVPEGFALTQPLTHRWGTFRYIPFDQPQSSTEIRRRLTAGQLFAVSEWLHPDVYQLLSDPNFYRIEGDSWKPTN